MREAHLNKKMIQATQKTYVLADSSKFGRRGFAKIASIEEIDAIVTDSNIKLTDLQRLDELGIKVIVANVKPDLSSSPQVTE